MSAETWKTEYYEDVAGAETWTDLKCFNHTRTKYIGTRKENLERHGVVKDGIKISDLCFNRITCSLCIKHEAISYSYPCNYCPITDTSIPCIYSDSAFRVFEFSGDPEPMIALMEELIARCDENGKYAPKDGGE